MTYSWQDLAQSLQGSRIVQLNRRTRVTVDELGVAKKFGVSPASIPNYLAAESASSASNSTGRPDGNARRRQHFLQ